MPAAPAAFSADDKNSAEAKMLRGERPPLPVHAPQKLGEIVVKACSVKERRYASAEDLHKDLSAFAATLTSAERDRVVISPAPNGNRPDKFFFEAPQKNHSPTQDATMTMGMLSGKETKSKKKSPMAVVDTLVATVSILIVVGAIVVAIFLQKTDDSVAKFEEALLENDYIAAAQIYRDEIRYGNSNTIAATERVVANQAESIETTYIRNEIEYDEARAQLQELDKLGVLPDEDMQRVIEAINELRASRVAYQSAQNSIASGEYSRAISELAKVIERDENYPNAQQLLTSNISNFKNEVFRQVSRYETEKAYIAAVEKLIEALQVVPHDADFLTKIDELTAKHIAEIIAQADEVAAEGDYVAAVALLEEGARLYPTDSAINLSLSVYEEYIPIDMLAVVRAYDKDSNSKDFYNEGPVAWMAGDGYTNAMLLCGDRYRDEGYLLYNLGGQYAEFSGLIGHHDNNNNSSPIHIWLDGVLAYVFDLPKDAYPEEFTIDVRGVNQLKIIRGNRVANSWVVIANPQLRKR
jgi:tetratricopeptide (TPR) repeat protein